MKSFNTHLDVLALETKLLSVLANRTYNKIRPILIKVLDYPDMVIYKYSVPYEWNFHKAGEYK